MHQTTGSHQQYKHPTKPGRVTVAGKDAPDLPGLGVVGDTLEEVETLIREGMKLHIAGLIEDSLPVPEPVTQSARIAVPA